MARQYRPGIGLKAINAVMKGILGLGFGPPGVELMSVRGRRSGKVYKTPVSPVKRGGTTYLVSPYGTGGWARNVRAAGEVNLGRGRHLPSYRSVEVEASEAGPVLRQYVAENKITAPYFDATTASPDQAWVAEAPTHPVFRLEVK
jgi:deazaflavin-dependent oxidoreductase (nitroreductase family)